MKNRAMPSEIMGGSIETENAAGHEVVVNGARSPKAAVQPVTNNNIVDEEPSSIINDEEVDSDMIDDGSDEKTYDGYQAIQSANSSPSREEEMRLMKEARMKNRAMPSEIMGGSIDL